MNQQIKNIKAEMINCPNVIKKAHETTSQEAKQTLRVNIKGGFTIKLLKAKDKEKISKGVTENWLFTNKGTSLRLIDDFLSKTM